MPARVVFHLVTLVAVCILQPFVVHATDRSRSATSEKIAEPSTYRMTDFRAPTPSTITGGRVIGDKDAMLLWKAKQAIFIDVLPRAERPKKLPKRILWRTKKRFNIPGSIWLVDVGYGKLSKERAAYFERNLTRMTAGDRARTLVFYCLRQCWMSWNAAKRAIALGYTNVIWYPNGTDGWTSIGGPLARSKPVPMSATTN
ncbi:MAG: PQQ-dependent catabolism-associated CXXCW motif protein [Hyphomicrobiaceae bacterium]